MSESTSEALSKRGPGRPRKVVMPEPQRAAADRDEPDPHTVVGRQFFLNLLGISRATFNKLAKEDPEFPPSFRLHGNYRHWLRQDAIDYVVRKASRAKEAAAAKAAKAAKASRKGSSGAAVG
ncbi:hypothetical protein AWB67_00974 [Caballeronia terrestris]|uniref:AlpA family phage regulatory protein n=1 Tax=Caballeronia terrestris TaxID=1226301 RepID=A0A158G0M6_9BURK|nr:hypothetical protein [Caballeronia terrestris]SAL24970.1 hypothetical protein AWB67_00974 [Caballeronia terrestris]